MNELSDPALNALKKDKVLKLLNNINELLYRGKNCLHKKENRNGKQPRQIIHEISGFGDTNYTGRVMRQESSNYTPDGIKLAIALRETYNLVFYDDLNVAPARKETFTPLVQLAKKLTLNLVDVSTPTDRHDDIPYENILKTEDLITERKGHATIVRERFVVFVGADASTAATPSNDPLPDQAESIQRLRARFEGVKPSLIDDKKKYIRKQSNVSGLNDFEVTVQALCAFNRKMVIEGLKDLCGYRHTTSLSYEIIAHLLKHRFIDVVVNVNNDEVLDNAIEEELPDKDDYRFIYTAGHCPQNVKDLYIDYRLRKPMYVKCHGTISHPNSLRLEGQQAFVTEPAIQQHLTDTLIGKLEKENDTKVEELPLNLIIIGFSMDNVALNRVLQTVLNNKKKSVTIWLFEFDRTDNEEETVSKRIEKLFNSSDCEVKPTLKRIPVSKKVPLGIQLTRLWEATSDGFAEPYVPQGIARHQLTSHVFGRYSPIRLNSNSSHQKSYLNDRLYLEVAIMILQTDGFIHLSRIGKNRAGKFYQLLKDNKEEHPHIGKYLRNMGLKKYRNFMHDTYHIPPEEKVQTKADILEYVIKHLLNGKTLKNTTALKNPKVRKTFIEYAEAIQEKRLGMINPKYTHIHGNRFSKVTTKDVMNTSLAWVYNYRKFLSPEGLKKWDVMLAVTEKGRFLYHDLQDEVNTVLSEKKFALVLSRFDCDAPMTAYTERLRERLGKIGDGLRFRSWWMHNQHMVIFLKRKSRFPENYEDHDWNKHWERVGGFYYTSRMLSRRISPVRLESYDLFKAMTDFAIYYDGSAKAFIPEDYKPIVTQDDVDDTLNKLLWTWNDTE